MLRIQDMKRKQMNTHLQRSRCINLNVIHNHMNKYRRKTHVAFNEYVYIKTFAFIVDVVYGTRGGGREGMMNGGCWGCGGISNT